MTTLDRSGALAGGRVALVAVLGVLTAVAWVAMWLAGGALHHHAPAHAEPSAAGAVTFVAGWTVMTVAMMLPTSIPILVVFRDLVEKREDRGRLVALVIVGYLAAWSAFGLAVYALIRVVGASGIVPPLDDRIAGGALLLLAGGFQFSALKYRCLDRCRSPVGFVLTHYRGRRPRREAVRLGLDHGRYCVGCCWALMLLMFVVGAGSLAGMLVLAVVMAVEKNLSWGRRAARPIGYVLLSGGVVLLALGLTGAQ